MSKIFSLPKLVFILAGLTACFPNLKPVKSASSNLQTEEVCTNEPSSFLLLPENCQLKILENLTPLDLVKFAKVLSTKTSEIGFQALLARAKLKVPESIQVSLDRYAAHIRKCIGRSFISQQRNDPIFVEKLFISYLTYLKLTHSSNRSSRSSSRFTGVNVRSEVDPIVLGKNHIVYARKNDRQGKIYLEVRDSVSLKVIASQEYRKPIESLGALGPHSFLVKEIEGQSHLWTFTANSFKNENRQIQRQVQVITIKNMDAYFTLENGQLTSFSLHDREFRETRLGTFPPEDSKLNRSSLEIIGTSPDQLVTLEKMSGRTSLKTWHLDSKSLAAKQDTFKLKSVHEFEGEYDSAKLENKMLSFALVRDQQHAFLLYDTVADQEVLKVHDPQPYIKDRFKLTYLDGYSFFISKPSLPRGLNYELSIYSGSDWKNIHQKERKIYSTQQGVAVWDDYITFIYSDQIRFTSIENPNNSLLAHTNFLDDGVYPLTPAILGIARVEGAYISRHQNGFTIHSLWKTILEQHSLVVI